MNSSIEWLIEPLDADSNKIIAAQLHQKIYDAGAIEARDTENKQHNVYLVPDFAFISFLQRSKSSLNIKFVIYKRRILNGGYRSDLEVVPFKPKRVMRITKKRKLN